MATPIKPGGGTSSGKCDHLDVANWKDAADPKRPSLIRTTCRVCGRFLGYRPVEVKKTRKKKGANGDA